ncbi:MAG: DUF6516 family protein [Pseudomonadota bacterium]
MRIEEYFRQVQKIIDSRPIIQSSEILFDKRSTYQGFIRGDVYFLDNSTLHLREFVDVETYEDRLMYVYQYVSPSRELIFRYDNTGHHKELGLATYPHHKHKLQESNVVPSVAPDLAGILDEIDSMIQLP